MTSTSEFLRSILNRWRERAREEQNRALWQNFARALGLLAIALLSALYSSNVARAGRMIPAGIFAVLALGMAIWVGIRFVPRLAANVAWDWLPFFSDYHITREGWIHLGVIIIVGFAAINTNNNLLYMVLSALLAVLPLSGFFSGVNFRRLKLDLHMPDHCFAGETFPLSFQLFNAKTIFPSFSLRVENFDKTRFRFSPFYLACLPAQSENVRTTEAIFPSRGMYRVERVKILSRYPFGFFLKAREYPVDTECISYPQIIPPEQLNLTAVDILGSAPRFERGVGNDLYMIRDYRPSDSARYVHWKASAKTATLKTREFAREESHKLTIFFDRSARLDEVSRFERLVSYAASTVVYLIRDGIETSLVTDEWTSGYGNSESHKETILQYLALVQSSSSIYSPLIDSGDGVMVLSLKNASPL